MPAEFQKAIVLTLTNCKNLIENLDDILIVTKWSKQTHKELLKNVWNKLNDQTPAISLDKYKFACKQVKWLDYNINSEGKKPLTRKTDTNKKIFKQLKLFMGSIHDLTRYIPIFA